MSIPEIIKNKMVTWQGFQDYHKMITDELPSLGTNNTNGSLKRAAFAWGKNNSFNSLTDEQQILILGTGNANIKANQGFILGSNNQIMTGVTSPADIQTILLGDSNQLQKVTAGESSSLNPLQCFIIGHSNIIKGNVSKTLLIGNNLTFENNNTTNNSPAIIIGRYNNSISIDDALVVAYGSETNPRNVFSIDVYGNANALGSITCNGNNNQLGATTFTGDLKLQSPSVLKSKDDKTIISSTGQIFSSFLGRPIIKNNGAVDLYAKDQARWWLVGTPDDKTLYINTEELDSETAKKFTCPTTIAFHAGSDTLYANLKCGDLTANSITSSGNNIQKTRYWPEGTVDKTSENLINDYLLFNNGVYIANISFDFNGASYYIQAFIILDDGASGGGIIFPMFAYANVGGEIRHMTNLDQKLLGEWRASSVYLQAHPDTLIRCASLYMETTHGFTFENLTITSIKPLITSSSKKWGST